MSNGRRRISKAQWSSMGGLRNGRLFRVQSKSGAWRYYEALG